MLLAKQRIAKRAICALYFWGKRLTKFSQKYRGHQTRYSFGNEVLSYEHSNTEDSVAFEVKYDEIDVDNEIRSTSKNPIFKFGSFPFILLAIFAIGKASLTADSVDKLLAALGVAMFWMLVAGIFWLKYLRSKISLSLFDSFRGRLVIVHDGQEAEIINLLRKLVVNNLSSLENSHDTKIQ